MNFDLTWKLAGMRTQSCFYLMSQSQQFIYVYNVLVYTSGKRIFFIQEITPQKYTKYCINRANGSMVKWEQTYIPPEKKTCWQYPLGITRLLTIVRTIKDLRAKAKAKNGTGKEERALLPVWNREQRLSFDWIFLLLPKEGFQAQSRHASRKPST